MHALRPPCAAPAPACVAAAQRRRRGRSQPAVVTRAAFGAKPAAAADPFSPKAPRPRAGAPAPAPAPAQAADTDRGPPRWDGAQPPRFPVPPELREPGAPPCTASARLVSLESVFQGSGLADAFHASSAFRAALRAAARADLFRDPGRGRVAEMLDARSTCVLDWRLGTAPGAVCAAMDAALAAAGVSLRGAELLRGLTALCAAPDAAGDTTAGSLTDIVDNGRQAVRHSWHQDSGLRVNTVLLGFPPADHFDGPGVFSHVIALSHPLATPPGAARGAVVEWERSFAPALATPPLPFAYVLRPAFGRGRELVVYSDATHLHSAPDAINREAVWRFM